MQGTLGHNEIWHFGSVGELGMAGSKHEDVLKFFFVISVWTIIKCHLNATGCVCFGLISKVIG